MEYEDADMQKACETLYRNIVDKRMYLTGGIGSSGKLERFTTDYDLPNDRMYCESCASVGLMMFSQRMASLTGNAGYYDTVERALCNTVMAGISKDADRYFYVNPLEVWPDNCLPSTSMSHVKPVRQKWFACACCPPNIARILASLGQYIYAQSDTALYVNMFISSQWNTTINGTEVKLDMKAEHMTGGKVTLTLETEAPVELRIRLPWYLRSPSLSRDGREETLNVENGYAVDSVCGKTKLEIGGSVEAKFVAANRNVRADVGKVALMKGPYVYCLEQVDNGENLASIFVSPAAPIEELAPQQDLPGTLPTLQVSGRRLVQTIAQQDDLYGDPSFDVQDVTLKAIPYALWCNRQSGEMLVWMHAQV